MNKDILPVLHVLVVVYDVQPWLPLVLQIFITILPVATLNLAQQ